VAQKAIRVAIRIAEVPQRGIEVYKRRETASTLNAGRVNYFAFFMDGCEEAVED
jgi:hypothetical protein